MKLCECGCGKNTPIAKQTRTGREQIKGIPLRFINGHNSRFRGTLKERFEQFFDKTPNSCWIWKGAKHPRGYGEFTINRKLKYASRVAYELYKGPIPEGYYVCHKCDNPSCVNPDHLFAGMQNDNLQDMVKKGRSNYGEKHPHVKLTEKDVLNIRKDIRTQERIAKDYNVSRSTIEDIKAKRTWKHI